MINIKKLQKEYQDLSHQLSSQETLNDREKYQQLAKRFSFLEKLLALAEKKEQHLRAKNHLEKMVSDSKEDEDVKGLAREELIVLEENIKRLDEDIENKVFEENSPQRDIIIEIRAASGGEESALFSASLFKMYSKCIENKGWKQEILSFNSTEIGGIKEAIFSVKGQGAYNYLKFESGVHRVQRVPVTESGGRIHTSTVTVAVLIEPKEVELKINPDDLKIETCRASGAGGQHVNVTDSAVRMQHLPTGIVVTCQDERSQIKNRAKALRVLKARIMERMQREETNKITEARRGQVGTGDRSEKIRTYNFPERRVTDHRINFTFHRLEAVLEGDIDEFVKRLLKEERQKIYETKGLA
ncbi:MAG: peptide chain release factor 1 [Candidatus Omnitrophota bacterium]|nr:peptide chain release factor 1 [Candidatus Omnitrophota bacterium]